MKANSLLLGYIVPVTDQRGKERYLEKLRIIHCVDAYEIPKSMARCDIDLS